MLGIVGSVSVYMIVDYERRIRIEQETDHLITDSCYRRTDGRPVQLPPKQKFRIAGLDTYLAVQRYNRVYAALQEKGDNADPRDLQKLFKMK